MGPQIHTVGSRDAGALLAAVLEGVEPIVRQFSSIRVPVNAEETTVMARTLIHRR